MNKRLTEIFSVLPECHTFADIGCDHGYMAQAMLYSGKCKRAIISDVSEKCLQKAKDLLERFIKEGKVDSAVSDGFDKVGTCDLALIAGMGGEEIVSIIEKAKELPENLVLQPMKNVDKVRVAVVKAGYRIVKDYVFFVGGVFYDLIVLQKGKDVLTQEEIEFGRTNLQEKGKAFKGMILDRLNKYKTYSENPSVSEDAREEMISQIKKLEKYV